jgi:hypothetical protein
MNKREKLQQVLEASDAGWVFEEPIEEALEEAEEVGFNDAVREIANGEYAHPLVTEALERLAYLQNGGEWHRETTGDLYVQGFKDALKTLGVLK